VRKLKIKKLLKAGILTAALTATTFAPITVKADDSDTLRWADFTDEETTEDSAEDIVYSILRGSNLNYGDIKITKLSSTEVHLYGVTQCAKVCSKVYLGLYLEQKTDGSYGTYKMWDFDTSNAGSLIRGIDVKVPSGHYYRLRGYHSAVNDGTRETTETLTDGIWVN
jgi:hypothetical protein